MQITGQFAATEITAHTSTAYAFAKDATDILNDVRKFADVGTAATDLRSAIIMLRSAVEWAETALLATGA